MSIKGSSRRAAAEQQAAAAAGKPRNKRGPSAAQRKRWQLGTAVETNTRGPPARGGFDAAGTSSAPAGRGTSTQSQLAATSQAAATRDAMGSSSPTASAASDARSPFEAAQAGSAPNESAPHADSPVQHSGFSGEREVAQVEGGISPFRQMQENAQPAAATSQQGGSQPAGAARALRAGSTDSVDSTSSVESGSPSVCHVF